MEELIKIIGATCLKHHDSGEASCNREARLILQALADNGYEVVKSISSNAVLAVTSDSKENNKESEMAVAFAEWLFAKTDWRTKNFKELYEMFEKQKAKATDR